MGISKLRRFNPFSKILEPDFSRAMIAQEKILVAVGQAQARWSQSSDCPSLSDSEFRIFSQFGEDGIIQYILGRVPIKDQFFIELGVQDYSEANTRFLLLKDNWAGLIIDAGSAHINSAHNRHLFWRHSLHALEAYVTAENINAVISRAGIEGDIGLMSIDIDGNDYWVFKALEAVTPIILIIEYNSLLGPNRAVTTPYNPQFDRFEAHYSGLYWGASLLALQKLASERSYSLIGSNSAGNNAFFIREDMLGDLSPMTASQAWVHNKYRDSRNKSGSLSYITGHHEQRQLIADLPLVDLDSGQLMTVADL